MARSSVAASCSSPNESSPSSVSTSFSTFSVQKPPVSLSPSSIRIQGQFTLFLILALQLHLFICHALIAMPPLPLPFHPDLYPSIVPFKPRKKISVFYLLCSPNSRLQTALLSYLCAPSLCFPDGHLVISMSLTSSRNFLSTLNTKKKIPICSG